MPEDKLPPQNIEAEQFILGALLIDPSSVNKVVDLLSPEAFYKESHQLVFEAITELSSSNQPVDILTVAEVLKKKGKLDLAGGRLYLTDLANAVSSSGNIEYYAKIVDSYDTLRRIISTGSEMVTSAFESDAEVEDVLNEAQKKIFNLAQKNIKRDFVALPEILDTVMETINDKYDKPGINGISTHFSDVDALTGGFQKSDMIIIAARPSMGKTAFALNIATNMAIKDKVPVGIFSLEMSKESLVERMLCSEAEVDSHRLKTKNMQDYDWKKIARAMSRLSEAPIFIDDTSSMTTLELQAKARRLKAEHDIGLIIIDFLTMLKGAQKRPESRFQEVSEIARSLKSIAREINVPVIVISQLSRSIEQRNDQTPRMSDLRESGEIEQVADLIMFVHRDDYYDRTQMNSEAKIIVAKHRNGSTGTAELMFRKEITKFVNKSNEEVPVNNAQ